MLCAAAIPGPVIDALLYSRPELTALTVMVLPLEIEAMKEAFSGLM